MQQKPKPFEFKYTSNPKPKDKLIRTVTGGTVTQQQNIWLMLGLGIGSLLLGIIVGMFIQSKRKSASK